jgi:2-polyprenyl-3-methyl-5-hydroxy-6-metoxy-1,4-benzoquinol methylase
MPRSNNLEFRSRIYADYTKTTSANPYATATMPLDGQIRQYYRRWHRFLPHDHEARILDVGCGGGEFLLFLRKEGYANTEGIDISPEQIEFARSRGLQEIKVADAIDYLAIAKNAYRLINIQNLLEHLTEKDLFELLDLVARALEPGGLVFGVVPNSKSLLSARVRYADITHERSFTPESLRQSFVAVGLKPVLIAELGPLVHGLSSAVRWAVWQLVRFGIWLALLAESADYRDRVYTQNMMFVAEKISNYRPNSERSLSKK